MSERINWTVIRTTSGSFATSLWLGMTLYAYAEWYWRVVRDTDVIAHWSEQAAGKDINEAKQRAQAAAIVQHSLRIQQLPIR